MPMISVKTAAGRVARESARGPFIPSDHYVSVADSRYMQRRINDGDVILEKAAEKKPAGEPAMAQTPIPPAAPKA